MILNGKRNVAGIISNNGDGFTSTMRTLTHASFLHTFTFSNNKVFFSHPTLSIGSRVLRHALSL